MNPDADDKKRGVLLKLLNKFCDCFALELDKLELTSMTTIDIQKKLGNKSVMCKPYKKSAEDREEISRIVGDRKGYIVVTETVSLYISPVLLVSREGKHRLCVDYRKLNKQNLRQHFPLPDINE